jgi:nucleoside-diphosphate-sugar epimerase
MMPRGRRAAITGSSGYLGSIIRQDLASAGWDTVGLVRTPSERDERRFSLVEPPAPGLLDGVDLLVHCAYDMRLRRAPDIWRINVDGTRRLLATAMASGVKRTIVLSSMSAYEGTQQIYGRAKLDIEVAAREVGAIVLRPGLVYGPRAGGMAGALTRFANLPLVPVMAAGSYQFTLHEDDFSRAIRVLADHPGLGPFDEPIGLANPVAVRFRDVVRGLARISTGRSCRTLSVPWTVVYRALQLAEAVGVDLPFRADSVLGLAFPAPSVPHLEVLSDLGIRLRRFSEPEAVATGRAGRMDLGGDIR